MGKVSKNARTDRGKNSGGKDFIKVVISEKNPETGKYIFKTKMVHKDKVDEFMAANK